MGRYNFNQRTRDGYEISPEQAAKWLERNDNNRNVNVAKVKKMAKDMREGHWDTTHQGIAIASDGTLVDGQHRLLAIVESGVTVRMNVTFNAAKSQHIDSGNIRSMANRVQMSEYDMSWTNNTILSAANLIGRVFAGSNLSHEEALSEWLMKYRTQIESATKCISRCYKNIRSDKNFLKKERDIKNWDISAVTSRYKIFYNCPCGDIFASAA